MSGELDARSRTPAPERSSLLLPPLPSPPKRSLSLLPWATHLFSGSSLPALGHRIAPSGDGSLDSFIGISGIGISSGEGDPAATREFPAAESGPASLRHCSSALSLGGVLFKALRLG